MDTQERIRQTVTGNPVVLFMKGTAQFPQCGFSATAIQVLKACGVKQVHTVNVLEDAEVRKGGLATAGTEITRTSSHYFASACRKQTSGRFRNQRRYLGAADKARCSRKFTIGAGSFRLCGW